MKSWKVIYDDSCPVCLAALDRLRQLDQLNLVQFVPLSDRSMSENAAPISRADLEKAIHVITPDNQLYSGSDAIAVLASMMPRTRWLGRLLRLPGIKQMARPIYRLIARHRLKLSRLISAGP